MDNNDTIINAYIEQLTPVERTILNTAHKMLGSSFDISKSIGFLEWIRGNPLNPT